MNLAARIEILATPRLLLRPWQLEDAQVLVELLQDEEIYRWTSSIPYPYTIDHAREFLAGRETADESGESFVWAITERESGTVMGAIGLHEVSRDRGRAEMGYWIGEQFRGVGFATESARRVLAWCFEVAELHRVQATYLPGNLASSRVMQSVGMREEGLLRGYGFKDGEHVDLHLYAILRDDPNWSSSEVQLS